MFRLLKRVWLPLVIVIVLVIGGMTVSRIRTFFGADDGSGLSAAPAEDTEPFNPKVVKYEIFGTGTMADVNYLDLDAEPQRVDGASLPWTLVLESTAPRCSRTSWPRVTATASRAASRSTTKSRMSAPPPASTPRRSAW